MYPLAMEIILVLLGLLIWGCSHFFFGAANRTVGLGSLARFVLQVLAIWSVFSVGLIALFVFSDQSANLGYLIFPLLIAAAVSSIGGATLTSALRRRTGAQ